MSWREKIISFYQNLTSVDVIFLKLIQMLHTIKILYFFTRQLRFYLYVMKCCVCVTNVSYGKYVCKLHEFETLLM